MRRLAPSPKEIATLRRLLADPANTQRSVAATMGWPVRRIERLVPRLALPTHSRGRFQGMRDGRWKGGRIVDKNGYVLVWCPDHPHGRKHTNYVLEHRLVMEALLGRLLLQTEVVHHRDKNKQNNNPSNLQVFGSNGAHLKAELTGHCPKWTPEGRALIRSRVRQPRATQRA